MKKLLFYLTMPIRFNYWLMLEQYNQQWDEKLSRLIGTEQIVILDDYYMKIGDHTLWYTNFPYGSFTLRRDPYKEEQLDYEFRPSRYTIYRLGKLVQAERNKLMAIQIKQATA